MTKKPLLILFALVAFAANSILCRYGLHGDLIDPYSFTIIRLIAGAIALIAIITLSHQASYKIQQRHCFGAFFLLVYAATFSFAYIALDTATGALILFGAVQITMIGLALFKGQQLSKQEWCGLIIACSGFFLLTLPHITAPTWQGLLLMLISGISWALYTLNGNKSQQPLNDTVLNFLLAAPVSLLLITLMDTHTLSTSGIIIAITSGALTSGIGYAVWLPSCLQSVLAKQPAPSYLCLLSPLLVDYFF